MKARVQYLEGRSLLHRMHPLIKGAWLIVLSLSVFLVPSPWFILGFLVLLWLGFRSAGASLGQLTGMRLIVPTALFLAGLQMAFVRSGEVALRLWRYPVTVDGIQAGVYVGGRFLSIVLVSYLFVLTTHPGELAHAMMQAGVPYRYGYSLITALRMVPMFQVEADTIHKAQLARGIRLDRGGVPGLVEAARQMLMPLLVSALGKADTLAVSMEGRCFGMYPRRTHLRSAAFHREDILSLVVLAVWAVGIAELRLRLA
jgi:energy-coupling factor transport system permease protein